MTIGLNSTVYSNDFPTALVVETDGTEALIEFPDGKMAVALVSDLSEGMRPPGRPKSKVVVTAPAADKPVKGQRVPAEDQVLTCAQGHTWTRAPQRGKPPKYCPNHAPVATKPAERRTRVPKGVSPLAAKLCAEPEPNVQHLHCEAGDHDWTREPKRGKPPVNCPQHTTAPTTVTRQVPVIDLSALNPSYDEKLKLDYITSQLERGRDQRDANLLLQTRGDILRRLQQRAHISEPIEVAA